MLSRLLETIHFLLHLSTSNKKSISFYWDNFNLRTNIRTGFILLKMRTYYSSQSFKLYGKQFFPTTLSVTQRRARIGPVILEFISQLLFLEQFLSGKITWSSKFFNNWSSLDVLLAAPCCVSFCIVSASLYEKVIETQWNFYHTHFIWNTILKL